jgi:sphingomyelin phosphodiesterase
LISFFRYESTIVAQFFGHTHFDEFELFYDNSDAARVTSIAYIGPSVTPYYDLNPGYRIYYVDADHPQTTRVSSAAMNYKREILTVGFDFAQAVLDHENWIMSLKDANMFGYPIWYKLYTAKSAYNMNSLMPQEWDTLLEKLTSDSEVFDLYYK